MKAKIPGICHPEAGYNVSCKRAGSDDAVCRICRNRGISSRIGDILVSIQEASGTIGIERIITLQLVVPPHGDGRIIDDPVLIEQCLSVNHGLSEKEVLLVGVVLPHTFFQSGIHCILLCIIFVWTAIVNSYSHRLRCGRTDRMVAVVPLQIEALRSPSGIQIVSTVPSWHHYATITKHNEMQSFLKEWCHSLKRTLLFPF